MNGDELLRMMHRVRKKLDNDGWFFDFYSTAFRQRPRMIRAAIASAHAHGEFIGGNVFGLPHRRPVPVRSDFASVQDFRNLILNRPAVRRLVRLLPVVYHLNNNPGQPPQRRLPVHPSLQQRPAPRADSPPRQAAGRARVSGLLPRPLSGVHPRSARARQRPLPVLLQRLPRPAGARRRSGTC